MLEKKYSKKTDAYFVTFRLPADLEAKSAYVCGEFNDWDKTRHKMRKLKDGSFSTTLRLAPGRSYRYRYWLDGERWENDWEADDYISNEYGSEDSLVVLDEAP